MWMVQTQNVSVANGNYIWGVQNCMPMHATLHWFTNLYTLNITGSGIIASLQKRRKAIAIEPIEEFAMKIKSRLLEFNDQRESSPEIPPQTSD